MVLPADPAETDDRAEERPANPTGPDHPVDRAAAGEAARSVHRSLRISRGSLRTVKKVGYATGGGVAVAGGAAFAGQVSMPGWPVMVGLLALAAVLATPLVLAAYMLTSLAGKGREIATSVDDVCVLLDTTAAALSAVFGTIVHGPPAPAGSTGTGTGALP